MHDARATSAGGAAGLAYRGHPGSRFVASDDNARSNVWFKAVDLERALEATLGDGVAPAPDSGITRQPPRTSGQPLAWP